MTYDADSCRIYHPETENCIYEDEKQGLYGLKQ